MKVSCGFIIVSKGKWLIAHVTNGKNWDFPKGVGHEGEDELHTALREAQEEAGIDLTPYLSTVHDFGRHPYQPKKKDLHLWGIHVPDLDASSLVCESMVNAPVPFPEVDSFMLVPPTMISNFLAPRMLEWVDSHVATHQDWGYSCFQSSTSRSTSSASELLEWDSTLIEEKKTSSLQG